MNEEIQEKVLIIQALAMDVSRNPEFHVETSYDGGVNWFRVTFWRNEHGMHDCDYNHVHQLNSCTVEELDGTIEKLEELG